MTTRLVLQGQDWRQFDSGQIRILERMARGESLGAVLDAVVGLIEDFSEGICSILLVDNERGTVHHGAARRLSPDYMQLIDGSSIGPAAGSCGTAAYLKTRVVVTDISTHPFWAAYRHVAEPYGLRACWSSPILSGDGVVLGTFAVYYTEPRGPDPWEVDVVDNATHLAGLAIKKHQDETAVLRAQRALVLREAELRRIFENVHDVVFHVAVEDPCTFRFLSVNPAFLAATGLSFEQVEGRLVSEVIPEPSASLVIANYRRALSEGRTVRWEEVTEYPAGKKYGDVSITPIRTPDGSVTLVGTVHDLTEQRSLQEQLAQAQRMDSLGKLASGVAHDFNNILTAVMGNIQIAASLVSEESARGSLATALSGCRRAAELTRRILTFSRRDVPEVGVVRLQSIVSEIALLLRAAIPAGVAIESNLPESVPPVQGDAAQLQQVVLNLATNGVHALRGRGQLRFDLEATGPPTGPLVIGESLPTGSYVRLAVSDDGGGMAPEIAARAFDAYFTTKPTVEGTGLGLTLVKGIVRDHSGDISVQSTPENGTTICVFLPAASEGREQTTEVPSGGGPARGAGERILFVDDEESILALAREVLTLHGFRASCFQSPTDALGALHAEPESFDLLFTDQQMPELDGAQLVRAARQLRPGLPVVLCSGWLRPEEEEQALRSGVSIVLRKPISIAQMIEAISAALPSQRV